MRERETNDDMARLFTGSVNADLQGKYVNSYGGTYRSEEERYLLTIAAVLMLPTLFRETISQLLIE